MTDPATPSRRTVLRAFGGITAAAAALPNVSAVRVPALAGLPLAVSDRSVGMPQAMGVFAVARAAGVAGVELDLGRLGGPDLVNRLADSGTRQRFVAAAAEADVTVCALALTALGPDGFARHDRAVEFAGDMLASMRALRVLVGRLPVDAADDDALGRVVDRLRRLAPTAERDGLTIVIDTALPAYAVRDLLDAVGSPAVRAAVTASPGRDAVADYAVLGPARVAQVRYRHDQDRDASPELAALGRALVAGRFGGWVVVDRPAVAHEDPARNVRLAAGRLTSAFA